MDRDQIHVGVVERVESSHVAPVAVVTFGRSGHLVVVEVVDRRHPVLDEIRDDVAAHIVIGGVVVGVGADRVDEHLGGEDVIAHRHERLLRVVRASGGLRWFLHEAADPSGLVGIDAAERTRFGPRDPDAGNRCAGAAFDVELHHLLGVHAIHMVGAEHHDVVRILVVDQVQRLVDRIGGAGVPARAEPLLGRHRSDVLPRQTTQPPVLRNVAVQRMRLVLGQHTDTQIAGVDEVGQHEVDQPVGAAEGNSRLGPVRGEWVEPFSLASGHDDAKDVWQLPHGSKPNHHGWEGLAHWSFRRAGSPRIPLPSRPPAAVPVHYGQRYARGDDDP